MEALPITPEKASHQAAKPQGPRRLGDVFEVLLQEATIRLSARPADLAAFQSRRVNDEPGRRLTAAETVSADEAEDRREDSRLQTQTSTESAAEVPDLDAGETATVSFSTHKVTFTLTGDGSPTTNFKLGTDIITSGTIDVSSQIVAGTNNFSPATAAVTYDNDGGVTNAVVTALKAVVTTHGISYDAATGKLTIAIESDGANVTKIRDGTGSGVSFQIDGAGDFSEDGTSLIDLEDGLAHSIEIKVGGQVIATASIGIATSTGAGTDAAIVIDVGQGLFSETSNTADLNAPMENYLVLSDGSFQIRDSNSTLLGTVAYQKGDSLATLATSISNNVTNVSAKVIQSGSTFKLEVLHDNRDTLTFDADTGGLIALLNITNAGDGVFSANIDGSVGGGDNLSVTISGRTTTATSLTGAEGLKVFYNGSVDVDAIQLDFTSGFGSRLYFAIDAMLVSGSGIIDSNVATLTKQNTVQQDRADDILARLEQTRASLLHRFINMEVAPARAKSLQDSLTQTFDAMFASQKR
jgi:hypothetical protein